MDKSIFIQKAYLLHNGFFKYNSLPENVFYRSKIKITCPSHGDFEQLVSNHLSGSGCALCQHANYKNSSFVKNSIRLHFNKYDYSQVVYKNNSTKVKIICPHHGVFMQTPKNHLHNHGCLSCAIELKSRKQRKKIEDVINVFEKVHNNKYEYSKINYTNNKSKIIIICPIHGEFKQILSHHSRGNGCPSCSESKGENIINKILLENYIKIKRQKKFDNCKYKQKLPFDFYLTEFNVCIEFDGEQHFIQKDFFGGEKGLELIKLKDKIKEEYCKKNNIFLYRISYFDNIEEEINKIIYNLKNINMK